MANLTDTMADYAQKAETGDVPIYVYGTDNHNLGNGNSSILDPTTWGDRLDNAGKFIVGAAYSGFNGVANSAIKAANWLGADIEENNTSAQLAALDDNLGKYYEENKNSIDMAGFVVSSFIPGMGGVKLLNAGQRVLRGAETSGMLGANLSRATGLLAPKTEAYVKLAAADIASTNATYSALSANTLKAIGAGYGQAALEAAAFETAVSATMFASPVLDTQDATDIVKNIAIGTVVGGGIGGLINHAVSYGAIKKTVKGFNEVEKQFSDVAGLETNLAKADPAHRIIARQNTISNMPEVYTAEDILAGTVPGTEKFLAGLSEVDKRQVAESLSNKLSRMREESVVSMNNKNRMDMHALTGGVDKELANTLADQIQGLDAYQVFSNLEHLAEIGRVNTPLKVEGEITAHEAALTKAVKKAKGAPDIDSLTPPPYKVGYVKLHGEEAGTLQFETPNVLNIADTVASKEDVIKKVASYGFRNDKVFDIRNAADHYEAEARYLWADKDAYTINGMQIGEYDIPLLERAMFENVPSIKVAMKEGGTYELSGHQQIYNHLQQIKMEVANDLLSQGKNVEEIAKIVNVNKNFLLGEVPPQNLSAQYFARQEAKAQYSDSLREKNLWTQEKEDAFGYTPSTVKVAYDTKQLQGIDGNILQGMAYIKAQYKQYQQGVDTVLAKHMPEDLFSQLTHPTDEMLLNADRYGAGPGLASFANGSYGSLASSMEQIGSVTSRLRKTLKDNSTTTLNPHLYNLANKQELAVEFESINNYIQSTSELYGLTPDGTGIAPLKLLDWKAKIASGAKNVEPPVLQEGAKEFIPFKNDAVKDAWVARTSLTGDRTRAFQEVRNAQGLEDMKDPRALRPIRPDPKDYPYYAVVVDPTVTGVGHKSMIHAASAKELDQMIAKVSPQYEVYKGEQLKEYFKAHGEFDYERTLHENYIDASLRSTGVNNPFFQRTDPQLIAKSLLEDHLKSDDIFARELMNAKYEKEFTYLRNLGEQYTSTATSKYTGSYRDIENTTKNPYLNYVKTALDISQVSEYPLLQGLNTALDKVYSQTVGKISEAFQAAKSPDDLDNVNKLLQKYGTRSAYQDAATQLLANHTAPKGELLKFVGRANSIISSLVTRLDPFNAINNVIGSTVLYGSETKSVLRAIKAGNTEAVGELGNLLRAPAATSAGVAGQEGVMSAGNLLINAVKNFHAKDSVSDVTGKSLHEMYKGNGWTTRLSAQFHDMLDQLSLTGTESASELQKRINSAFQGAKVLADKGEVITGNKLAEEFNRFVSADTMRQITDVGVKAGVITEKEQLSYINSFVNRTQGNTLASQRPLMFQGALGQAIGLFQTFQFNTMQQLFRHVAEGAGKDAGMLLGLQGTMYGMNGLPAFNYLNTHIVGTLSGNPQHQDLYTSTYGMVGKNIGDLVLYGVPSNLLRANLYTRGDINPRQLTVVPTNPVDIPFINATIKTYDNVKNLVMGQANGASLWQGLLQGIEHNGLSRPLAGIAQTSQAINTGAVFSTTNKGNISGMNDIWSWATAVRLAGAKPFDEAVVNDATYRISAYQAADRSKMDALAKAVKTTVIGNGSPDPETVEKFAAQYAALKGPQSNFNKYMLKQIKESNTSQANKIVENLKSPYSQKMQMIMGGDTELMDGRDL